MSESARCVCVSGLSGCQCSRSATQEDLLCDYCRKVCRD